MFYSRSPRRGQGGGLFLQIFTFLAYVGVCWMTLGREFIFAWLTLLCGFICVFTKNEVSPPTLDLFTLSQVLVLGDYGLSGLA